ncbi:MAG: fused MFS/spermidine synthase [Bryobacteraceae bacterium]
MANPTIEREADQVRPGPADFARVWFWLATALVTGAIVMGLELVAFRLYAPYFGYSVYVWGSMISVVMGALACGYGLGGRLAHGSRPELYLYGAIFLSALYQMLILFVVGGLLPPLSTRGDFAGVFVATMVIFGPTMAALAVTGPLVVHLCARTACVGSAAGKTYGLSTVGSMAGIVVTTFFLIPGLGTQATMRLLCLATFVTAVLGLVANHRMWVAAILPAAALLVTPDFGWSENTVWTGESAYNLIRVVRRGTQTTLVLNGNNSVHTIRNEAGPWTGYYYDDFAVGPMLVHADRLLVLGLGAGGSIRSTQAVAPGMTIDAVEIDPKVVTAAIRWFGLDRSSPLLRIHVADARPWLARSRGVYDLVHLDLYQGGPYIPFYLVTKEFFQLVRAHLSVDGLVMMNVFDPSPSGRLRASVSATLHGVFPSVMSVRASHGNYMLLAFSRAVPVSEVRRRLQSAEPAGAFRDLAHGVASQIVEIHPSADTPVFTDDRAPVEEITRRVLAGE